jgi:hypothetical protein
MHSVAGMDGLKENQQFPGVRLTLLWTISRSKVVTGTPCTTAAIPPTTMNWMPASASKPINEGMSERDSMAKFFDHPHNSVMPVQPLVRRHPEHLPNKGNIESLFISSAGFTPCAGVIDFQSYTLLYWESV